MTQYQAIGPGPVVFLDANQSQQSIPLSFITFNGTVPVLSNTWPGYATDQAVANATIAQLANQGVLFANTTPLPAAGPSLIAKATETGTAGNAITITFANPIPALGTVDVTVSAVEVYPGLTVATVGTTLGTTSAAANGMVFVEAPGSGAPPVAFSGNLAQVGGQYQAVVPDAASDAAGAFTVQAIAAADAADAELINIKVIPDPSPATTFTLTVSWTKAATGQTLADLTGGSNPFGFLVTFTQPAGATGLPAAGVVVLQGGAPAVSNPASAATATIPSA